jgi:hypothetical protein
MWFVVNPDIESASSKGARRSRIAVSLSVGLEAFQTSESRAEARQFGLFPLRQEGHGYSCQEAGFSPSVRRAMSAPEVGTSKIKQSLRFETNLNIALLTEGERVWLRVYSHGPPDGGRARLIAGLYTWPS